MQTKTKPILFKSDMVRAILNGTKKKTRRTKNLKEINLKPDNFDFLSFSKELDNKPTNSTNLYARFVCKYNNLQKFIKPPYGYINDIIWVRETWAHTKQLNLNILDEHFGIVYKADAGDWENYEGWKWKPSIFMPKEACRIFLKIKNVRIERLFDISENDAIQEGIGRFQCDELNGKKRYVDHRLKRDAKERYLKDHSFSMPSDSFFNLWESINGEKSLDLNPYVFVYDFERTERPKNFLNQ